MVVHPCDGHLSDFLQHRLFPFQKDAVSEARARRFRVINGHGCGAGKSDISCAQLFCLMRLSREDRKAWHFPLPVLLLCQPNKVVEWSRCLHAVGSIPENRIWTPASASSSSSSASSTKPSPKQVKVSKLLTDHLLHPEITTCILDYLTPPSKPPKSKPPKEPPSTLQDAWVVIVTHTSIATHALSLATKKFRTLIIDESHLFKNPQSKKCLAVMRWLAEQQPPYVILNTANPIENFPADLFVQLHLLDPDRFPASGWYDFAQRYCFAMQRTIRCAGGTTRTVTQYRGVKDAPGLKQVLEAFLITVSTREMEQQVGAQRQPVHHQEVHLPCKNAKDVQKLKEITLEYKDKIRDPNEPHAIKYYQEMDLKIVKFKIRAMIPYLKTTLAKLHQQDPELRFICFGFHKAILGALEKMCMDQGWSYVRIDGSVSKKQPLFDKYQRGDALVAILSIEACGTGVSAHRGSHVWYCELPFKPSTLMQGGGRADRIGQKREVFIRYLLLEHSTDARRWKIIWEKLGSSSKVLDVAQHFKDQLSQAKKRPLQRIQEEDEEEEDCMFKPKKRKPDA